MKTKKIALLIFASALFFSCKKKEPEEGITPAFIQENLVGSWSGNGTADFAGGIAWTAEFEIESDGHYSGHVTSVETGSITSVFDNGNDDLDHPEKKFIIQSIDAFDKANGKVSFVHADGDLLEYQIQDLVFSDNYKKVDFEVAWGAEMQYSLEKLLPRKV